MARSALSPTQQPDERLETVRVGAVARIEGRTIQIRNVERSALGRLEFVLDTGEGLERMPAPRFFQLASAAKPPARDDEPSDRWLNALTELPDEERRRVEKRHQDLLQALTGSRHGDPDKDRAEGRLSRTYDPQLTTSTERFRAKSSELDALGEASISISTLRRQARQIQSEGIQALVHGNRKSWTDHLAGADSDVIAVLRHLLETQRTAAQVSKKTLRTKARAALDLEDLGKDLSDYKLSLLIGELSRSMGLHHDAAGRERVSMKPEVSYGRRSVSRPGEIVQIDATTTNIHVWDARLGWVRSTIVTAIDVFTRCIVALRVVTGSVTSRDAVMLLWDIGRPSVTRSGYPYELEAYAGMPRLVAVNDKPSDDEWGLIGRKPALSVSSVVIDHGREFDNAHFLSVCAKTGVDVIFCPPRTAHAKGVVESVHNMLREVQSLLLAFKGAAPTNHPKNIEELATLTAQDLRDALWEFILEIYHWREHRGLTELHRSEAPLCPAGVLETYLEAGGGVTVPTDPYRLISYMTSCQRTLHPYGVNIDSRTYTSSELIALRPHLARGIGTDAKPITVYYDRNDVSRVYVRHPISHEWLMVPRSGSTEEEQMPCSDMFDRALRLQIIRQGARPMSEAQVAQSSADYVNRWSTTKFEDRNAARIMALETGRAHEYAHDLADASPEFRNLAFGTRPSTPSTVQAEVIDTAPVDSDEILDADLIDDEDIDLDAIDDDPEAWL